MSEVFTLMLCLVESPTTPAATALEAERRFARHVEEFPIWKRFVKPPFLFDERYDMGVDWVLIQPITAEAYAELNHIDIQCVGDDYTAVFYTGHPNTHINPKKEPTPMKNPLKLVLTRTENAPKFVFGSQMQELFDKHVQLHPAWKNFLAEPIEFMSYGKNAWATKQALTSEPSDEDRAQMLGVQVFGFEVSLVPIAEDDTGEGIPAADKGWPDMHSHADVPLVPAGPREPGERAVDSLVAAVDGEIKMREGATDYNLTATQTGRLDSSKENRGNTPKPGHEVATRRAIGGGAVTELTGQPMHVWKKFEDTAPGGFTPTPPRSPMDGPSGYGTEEDRLAHVAARQPEGAFRRVVQKAFLEPKIEVTLRFPHEYAVRIGLRDTGYPDSVTVLGEAPDAEHHACWTFLTTMVKALLEEKQRPEQIHAVVTTAQEQWEALHGMHAYKKEKADPFIRDAATDDELGGSAQILAAFDGIPDDAHPKHAIRAFNDKLWHITPDTATRLRFDVTGDIATDTRTDVKYKVVSTLPEVEGHLLTSDEFEQNQLVRVYRNRTTGQFCVRKP